MSAFSKFSSVLDEQGLQDLYQMVYNDTKLTDDNMMDKSMELPRYATKYTIMLTEQEKILKGMKIDLDKIIQERHHYYRFGDYEFRLDTKSEIATYIDGDDKVITHKKMISFQEAVVDYLKATVSNISKTGFFIKSYIDLYKMKNGMI